MNVLSQLKRRNPWVRIEFYTHHSHHSLVKMQSEIDEVIVSDGINTLDLAAKKIHYLEPFAPIMKRQRHYSLHALDHLASTLGITLETHVHQLNCRQIDGAKKDYATIHVQPKWSPYKFWSLSKWSEIIRRVQSRGLAVCQIGALSDPPLPEAIDFRGRPIGDSIALIKSARLHLGVDSFSNHVTNISPVTPAVILWGSTSWRSFGYAHNVNIDLDLECGPCYRSIYGENRLELCPHDPLQSTTNPRHPCLDNLSVAAVWDAVDRLLLV